MPAETFYGHAVNAMCADGVIRKATPKRYLFDGSMAPDTVFSCPAFVRAHGKTIRGYVSGERSGEAEYTFRAYTYRKNARVIEANR